PDAETELGDLVAVAHRDAGNGGISHGCHRSNTTVTRIRSPVPGSSRRCGTVRGRGQNSKAHRAEGAPMTLTLQTTNQSRARAAAIVITDVQVATFGVGTAGPVTVTIAATTARLRLARMGGENMIGMSKAVRAQLSVQAGDQVEAQIAPDRAER